MKLVKRDEYKEMPWKNGLGVTSEIAIFPESAKFPQDDFLWRLSSAKIEANNTFSEFPGCDRHLIVIKGEGLLLNHKELRPMIPFHFPGEEKINCELIKGMVWDLGLIYKRGKIKAEIQILQYQPMLDSQQLSLHEGTHVLFCASGVCKIDGIKLAAMDSLIMEKGANLQCILEENSSLIIFHLRLR